MSDFLTILPLAFVSELVIALFIGIEISSLAGS
jgi:hypothetical protein